jgi:RNA polymerase sigma-70 factor (ECF subfamily)
MRDLATVLEPQIPALRRYAFALLRDRTAADDLVQDCLERAINRWYLLPLDADVRPWLFKVLYNLFLNQQRSRRRRPLHESFDDTKPESQGMVPPNQDGALLGRDILRQFATLSEEHQAVLLLVTVEGLSYEAAANVLGWPIGTVMSRLSRAREQLRRQIDGERPALRRVK